jgi:hypothetical protein
MRSVSSATRRLREKALTAVDSPPAPGLPQPYLQKERDGLRNPRIASDPSAHGALIHAQALGRLHLGKPQLSQGMPELLGRQGHSSVDNLSASGEAGKLPHAAESSLPHRATCPMFSSCCPFVQLNRRSDNSVERFYCWRSLRTNCVSSPPARCRDVPKSGRSLRRGAGCASPWPRSGRRHPARFGRGLGMVGRLGNVHGSVASFVGPLPWSRGPLGSWCGTSGGPCGQSCDWSTCGRSGRESRPGLRQARDQCPRASLAAPVAQGTSAV